MEFKKLKALIGDKVIKEIGELKFKYNTKYYDYEWELYVIENSDGALGLMNENGKVTIEPLYHTLEIENFVMVRVMNFDGKYGYLETSGEIIIPVIYDNITVEQNPDDDDYIIFKCYNDGNLIKTLDYNLY